MFFDSKKTFSNKKIKSVELKKKKNIDYKKYVRYVITLFLVFSIIFFWSNISKTVGYYIKQATWAVVKLIAKTTGKEAKTDAIGNVNILILGVGGKNHDGGYLTDSMMIASFNKKLKTITFLSIPRDLYVKYPWGGGGRINYIFAREYMKTRSFDRAANSLEKKLEEITGVGINYYVMVDFSGFEKLIDKLGGVKVNVPETIVDHTYPGPNRTYTTFRITKGVHYLDGKTALKYARSRHSTSDFSRSARQEQIIKAILKKLTSSDVVASPKKLKGLYLQFKETIKTDFDFETLLSFVPYAKEIKIHSYVLNADCYMRKTNWANLTPGCFLYPAERAAFNGQAVLLPDGSNNLKVDEYSKIQKFVLIALGYPELWLENSKIQILNGIGKKNIKKYYRGYLKPVASKLAWKLKNYGFNIVDVSNASSIFEKNKGYIYNPKETTQDLLQNFIGNIEYSTGDVTYSGKGYDMTIILGKEYLQK